MSENGWAEKLRQVFERGKQAWNSGRKNASTMFSADDLAFLAGIGCTAQEMFDFVDDQQRYGEPSFDTVLAIQKVRYDYFLKEMRGQTSGKTASMDELPSKTQSVEGIVWLPRLIAKARLKLRGEMPDDLMYGCGGDRAFSEKEQVDLGKFLKLVWESGTDDRRIIEAVKKRSLS